MVAYKEKRCFLCVSTVQHSCCLKRYSMDVNFGQQTTKVKQLADILERDIRSGVFVAGGVLPSINKLSGLYYVSRDTVFKAFAELRRRGLIDSTPGKGYYVVDGRKNVLLLLDEYSPFMNTLYNSFVENLPVGYKVDLWFHQYNERLFRNILEESTGRYSHYVIMNFDNEKFFPELYRMNSEKVLLLDFGRFDKGEYSYICQDFDENFYKALTDLSDRFSRYDACVFLYPNGTKHPDCSCGSFERFCASIGKKPLVVKNLSEVGVRKGYAYLAIRQTDVVEIVKSGRASGLRCGADFGLVAYNETPAYEIIDDGITALSIDWEMMGRMAAGFVSDGIPVHLFLPTKVHLRNSL